jgi:RNA polymerase sigma-70 factor (ECF subfamily)
MTDERPTPDHPEDFQRLYVQFYPSVMAYFRRQGFPLEEARDLTQDTFVRAFAGIAGFRREAAFKTWLLKIATNVWRNELRARGAQKREAPRVPLEDAPEYALAEGSMSGADDGKDGPFDALWERQRRELVQGALKDLPPQMRRCMQLHVGSDLKYREIAAVMKISIGAVKSQLHEARERLKTRLGRHLTGDGA